MPRGSFRQQMLRVREDAIVDAARRLLAQKGYERMTVDEVAADVGIAKASLYKHFTSKEQLAAAAMVRSLDRALDFLATLPADPQARPLEQLKAVVAWAMQAQLDGEMPALPAPQSTLHVLLMREPAVLARIATARERLGGWIAAAQAGGELDAALPAEVVLHTLCARACDPVPGLLKRSGRYSDGRIVAMLVATCFDGLARR